MSFGFLRVVIPIFLLVLLVLSQRFWFRSLRNWGGSVRSDSGRKALRALAPGALIFLICIFVLRVFVRGVLPAGGIWGFLAAMSQLWILSSMMAYLFFKAVRLIGWIWNGSARLVARRSTRPVVNEDRRSFFRYAARFAAAVPIVAAVYGYTSERFNFQVRRLDVPMANLPAALDGFKIAQLSDIHIGDFMPRTEVRRAVEMANALGAHVAFVTGDFITGMSDPLADCIEEISRLHAPLGVWGCNGNHEIYAEVEGEAQRLFAQHGMKLLRQERAELSWNGAKLNLIGVDYQRDHMVRGPKPPMLAGIEPLVRHEMPNILLSHNPNSFYKAAELGIELSLAGHTHGGQVDVEILDQDVNPARFITKFIAGLYDLPLGNGAADKRAAIYVNRGLGTIGLPARLGVAPEVTLLTLTRG